MARLAELDSVTGPCHTRCMEPETKRCAACGETKPIDDFHRSGRYRHAYCKPCANERTRQYGQANKARRNERLREWRRANPEAARAKDQRARLKRKYGLTPEDVEAMRVAQDGRCLICRVECDLFIDHCHTTGRVRGLLCPSCNTFLGRVEANPEILVRMAQYAGHATPPLASSSSTSA